MGFFRRMFRKTVEIDLVITPSGSAKDPRFHVSLRFATTGRTFANVGGSHGTLAGAQRKCRDIKRMGTFRVASIRSAPRSS